MRDDVENLLDIEEHRPMAKLVKSGNMMVDEHFDVGQSMDMPRDEVTLEKLRASASASRRRL